MMALNKLMMITILGGRTTPGRDSVGNWLFKHVHQHNALVPVWREMMNEVSCTLVGLCQPTAG